jgi:hypothetical protein
MIKHKKYVISLFVFTCFAHADMSQIRSTKFEKVHEPVSKGPVQIVAKLEGLLGNIGYTYDNRIVYSNHPFVSPDVRVAILDEKTGTSKPYPNASWNDPKSPNSMRLDSVLAVRGDAKGIVWMLDQGIRSNSTPKLVGWDSKKNELHRIIYLPAPVTNERSFLDDFMIDYKNNAIYMTDAGIHQGGIGKDAAIIVIDLKTGQARRVLEGDQSTVGDKNVLLFDENNNPVQAQDERGQSIPRVVGADGIVSDIDNVWVYYAPFSGDTMYRIRSEHLRNASLSDQDLSKKVEKYGYKTVNGGIGIDRANHIYSTDLQNGGIGFIDKNRNYKVFLGPVQLTKKDGSLSDHRFTFVDGLSYSHDGYMYSAMTYFGEEGKKPSYYIVKYKPLVPSEIGK